jgi:Domain of unknown function (DUF4326)
MPERVQLRRTKGWRMPPNTIKVDRTTKWGNPFIVGQEDPYHPGDGIKDRRHACSLYLDFASQNQGLIDVARSELRGLNLACWCPLPGPSEEDYCHASVLLRLAND